MKIPEKLRFLLLLIFLCVSFTSKAQTADPETEVSLGKGPILKQFDYVVERSNRYQEYKVIRQDWMNILKSQTADTLKSMRADIHELRAEADGYLEKISSLDSEKEEARQEVASLLKEKDNISLLGISMKKGMYKSVMWIVVAALAALLLFFIGRHNYSNSVTRQTKKLLDETRNEFEEFKKRSAEKEMKLRRDLQDEINKNL